eukprot:364754-Chlamydomonas_euryale.AAC.1
MQSQCKFTNTRDHSIHALNKNKAHLLRRCLLLFDTDNYKTEGGPAPVDRRIEALPDALPLALRARVALPLRLHAARPRVAAAPRQTGGRHAGHLQRHVELQRQAGWMLRRGSKVALRKMWKSSCQPRLQVSGQGRGHQGRGRQSGGRQVWVSGPGGCRQAGASG